MKRLLYKIFSGEASIEEIRIVKQWVEESEKNKESFLRERKIFDAIALSKDDRQTKENDNPGSIQPLKNKSLIYEILKITAVILITAGISFLYFKERRSVVDDAGIAVVTVPAGHRVNMTLPDGTSVWLNARTTLRYPASFSKDKRQVFIDGEGYFTVRKDEKRPFFVETGQYQVKVLGTSFNVDAYSDSPVFETALLEGRLVIYDSNNIRKEPVELKPNERVLLKDGQLCKMPIEDFNSYQWIDGLISFKDQSFRNIMKEFEKCYGITIVVNNKNVYRVVYTGKFSYSDGVDYALKVLQKNIRFDFRRDNNQRVIYIN
ncbi:MAG: FecR family protein [Dysgonamonadaceae bacterium]|jgi:ferric-dicitrate binding protein FerR (iron transport regulator)|nr:FecR family protein [Dysgonamonadaceae bacterium]